MAPVVATGCAYVYTHHFYQLQHAGSKRLFAFIIAAGLFYVWVAAGIIKRKQDAFTDVIVQSSFYVYVFSVLTLTGYFGFFSQVSAHHWWQQMIYRVNTRDGVNLTPFLFLKARHLLTYDTVGNFFMLLPLGIYLPLLYRATSNFFTVTFAAMLLSVCIELMQLATNFRIADVDDIVLNTAGASLGCIIYFLMRALFAGPAPAMRQYQSSS